MMIHRDFIETYDLIPAGSRVLCAVSGGADSMALLHYLWSHGEEWNITVCAAHYDHQLRGLESARDRTFVKDWCASHDIPLKIGFGEVRRHASEEHMGTEEAARELRYAFLEQARQELDCDWIMTAHNAEDQLETQILNLCRGAGLHGLCGIPPRRGKILRPLLQTTRSEILSYNEEHEVPFVEDHTNAEDEYARNRIRHHVLPVLQGINSAAAENAGTGAQLLRADEEYLEEAAAKVLKECLLPDGALSLKAVDGVHEAVAGRVIRQWTGTAVDHKSIRKILDQRRTTEYRILEIPGQRFALDHGALYPIQDEDIVIPDRELKPGQTTEVPEIGCAVRCEETDRVPEIHNSFSIFYLKYENIEGRIRCTSRREGDRLRLRNRQCTKKLKALFDEKDMTRRQRDAVLVIRDEKQVLAVDGFGVSEWAEARPGDRAVKITIVKNEMEQEHAEKH